MHSYLKELMRLRINLDKIKDDLQDVTYDEAEEIKGLKEFLEYLDLSINHGLECLQQGLSEDRKNTDNTITGVSEGKWSYDVFYFAYGRGLVNPCFIYMY